MDPSRRDQALGLDGLVLATSLEGRSSSNEDFHELELHHDEQRERRFQTWCPFEAGQWGQRFNTP